MKKGLEQLAAVREKSLAITDRFATFGNGELDSAVELNRPDPVEGLNPPETGSVPAPRKYPQELHDWAQRPVADAAWHRYGLAARSLARLEANLCRRRSNLRPKRRPKTRPPLVSFSLPGSAF